MEWSDYKTATIESTEASVLLLAQLAGDTFCAADITHFGSSSSLRQDMSVDLAASALCWHCCQPGHKKTRCLEYHLEIAMLSLVAPDTLASTVAEVRRLARNSIIGALNEGKQGKELRFPGCPNALHLQWPYRLPQPKYPTKGVWYGSCYMGDDG